jgi:hypothetical protein
MSEPKKRGRPSKADIAARNARVEGDDYTERLLRGEVTPAEKFDRHRADLDRAGYDLDTLAFEGDLVTKAQAYALRVWNGQSRDADRAWRIQRVKEALAGQGLSFEGVQLP